MTQQNNSMCKMCQKHEAFCMCASSSDPFHDFARDISKTPTIKVPIKKWADTLRETAEKINQDSTPEPKSLYTYLLERCKQSANRGDIFATFWKKNLSLWTQQEIEMAADLLRDDNFKVQIAPMEDNVRIHISWAY